MIGVRNVPPRRVLSRRMEGEEGLGGSISS